MVCSNNVLILHRFRYLDTTSAVKLTACGLEKSFIFYTAVEFTARYDYRLINLLNIFSYRYMRDRKVSNSSSDLQGHPR